MPAPRRAVRLEPVAALLLVVISRAVVVHGRVLGAVALARVVQLIRVRVLRQAARLVQRRGILAPAEAAEEAAPRVARGVVVAGGGAEALLLAVVADQGHLHEHGEDEEDAVAL